MTGLIVTANRTSAFSFMNTGPPTVHSAGQVQDHVLSDHRHQNKRFAARDVSTRIYERCSGFGGRASGLKSDIERNI
jgi:hypothetical protein